jgi:hypothetical protein
MQMLYNSDAYAVVQFDLPAPAPDVAATAATAATAEATATLHRGGFEIIDKQAGREIYLEGLLAERFRRGAQALAQAGVSSPERYDEFIAGFTGLAQQPLVLH